MSMHNDVGHRPEVPYWDSLMTDKNATGHAPPAKHSTPVRIRSTPPTEHVEALQTSSVLDGARVMTLSSISRSDGLEIFPIAFFGRASTTMSSRGRLYAASSASQSVRSSSSVVGDVDSNTMNATGSSPSRSW